MNQAVVSQGRPDLTVIDGDDPAQMQPHADVAAEASVLGSMIMSSDSYYDIRDEVIEVFGRHAPDVFYQPRHQTIYNAITSLYAEGLPTGPIAVGEYLRENGELTRVGGADYLHRLTAVASSSAAYHAGIILDKARLRHLEEAVVRSRQVIRVGEGSAEEIVATVQRDIEHATDVMDDDTECNTFGELLPVVCDQMEEDAARGDHVTGIKSGWPDLDNLTQGLHGGQVMIVAGTPGTGKTTAAVNMACDTAFRQDIPTAMFSLEMPKPHVVRRIISSETKISLTRIRSGSLDENEWHKIARMTDQLRQAPLYFDGNSDMTIDQISNRVRILKRKFGVKLVVIDHFHIMRLDVTRFGGNKTAALEEMANRVRVVARAHDVAVILLVQLNRAAGVTADNPPTMHDLKGTSGLEDNANIIVLAHRPDLYEKEHALSGEIHLYVAKNRDGPTGTVTLASQLHYARLSDMGGMGAPVDGPPPPPASFEVPQWAGPTGATEGEG